MDPQQQQLKQLQDLFINAQDILIITREQPSVDGLSASLALYSLFSEQRNLQGKQKKVVMAVSGRQGSQYSLLPLSDKIVSELGLRDLVIGVNGYVDNAIQSVNWYVDKGRLNVVFKSNPNVPMQFDLKNLDPFYAGTNFDVVVVLDTANPADLGNAYRQDPGMYSELPVVNISNNPQNSRFGRVNIVDSQVPSVSELAFQLSQILRLPLNSDAATLFLAGISDAIDQFQNKGLQTDAIVQQLQSYGARQLDTQAIRNQVNNPPLPAVQGMLVPPPQMPQYPYPGVPYGQMPQYPGYPQQMGYIPPGGYYPPPGYMPPQPQQYSYPQPQQPLQEQPQEVQQSEVYETVAEEVPSIQHDATQYSPYVPTSDIAGYGHVEPSVYMPENPPAQSVPDFKNAPKVYEGSRDR